MKDFKDNDAFKVKGVRRGRPTDSFIFDPEALNKKGHIYVLADHELDRETKLEYGRIVTQLRKDINLAAEAALHSDELAV